MKTLMWVAILVGLAFIAPRALPAAGSDSPALAIAGGREPRFEHLTIEEGLSQGNVEAIYQDRQGFMWFGTAAGLDRYDGHAIKTYRYDPDNPHSLLGTTVHHIMEDASGILWVATNQGLNQFDRATERFTRHTHDPANPTSISGSDVWRMLEDTRGNFWILTSDGGLNRLDRRTGQFTAYRHNPADPHSLSHDEGRALHLDRAGNLWVGTQGGGLDRFDPDSGGFIHYRHDPADPASLSENAVWSIWEDRQGILWVGTYEKGLASLDPKTGKFTRYASLPGHDAGLASAFVFGLTETRDGTLWVATYGKGLYSLDSKRQRFTGYQPNPADPTSINHAQHTVLYEDRQGALWIGNWGKGVNKVDFNAAKFLTYRHNPQDATSLSNDIITVIYEDPSDLLWLGTENGGLNRLDPATGQFTRYQAKPDDPHSLAGNAVYAIHQDRTGALWVGTRDGLNKMDLATGAFTRYLNDSKNPDSLASNDVRGICEDTEGTLWIGTSYGGLNRFDRATGKFKAYQHDPNNPNSLGTGIIHVMRCDPTGVVWLGLWGGGLNQFDPKTETFRRHENDPRDPASLVNNEVWSIWRGSTGDLWLGTSGGLGRLDPRSGKFTAYRRKDGLASDLIYAVLEDDQGRLWLGTAESGITVFDPKTGSMKTYDATDGLQSNQFYTGSAYKSRTGLLIFGGVNGFNIIDPAHIGYNAYIPPVVLTDFQIFNKSVSVNQPDSPLKQAINEAQEIVLSHDQSIFSIEFAALNYRFPRKNQYAYILEGFEKDWNQVDSRRRLVTYTNLDPGTYTFRVRASNNDGVWNEEGKSLPITITPPWWQTVGFRSLLAVLALGAAVGGYRWRVSSVENHNRELAAQVAARTSELAASNEQLRTAKDQAEAASQAKSVFLANVSHELRTPLNAILGFSELMRREAQAGQAMLSAAQRDNLAVIHHSGEHLLTLINDVLDLSKIEAGQASYQPMDCDLHGLLQDLRDLFEQRAADKRLSLQVRWGPATPRYARTDAVKLRQVLINLLGNAIKFTTEGGVLLDVDRVGGGWAGARRRRLRFTVADTGPGIGEDERDRLFQPFAQTRTGQTAREGTGLGLAISQEYVHLLGSEITVESEPGRGSRFGFELELDVIAGVAPPSVERSIVGLAPGQPRRRILVVDDQVYNRRLVVQLLVPLGFELAEAEDGAAALARWRDWRPDLICLDLRMPGLDGYDVARRIRAGEPERRTKLLALTASVFAEERDRVLAAGCDDFLRKPFRATELLEMMGRHLDLTFRYANDAKEATIPVPEEVNAARLRALPEPLPRQLQDAVMHLDTQRITELASQVAGLDPALGAWLHSQVQDLRYERLLDLLDSARGPANG